MSNYQYPWEEIFQDCADLITVQIRDGKNVPETFPQLYQLFEKWYTERGKKVPEQRHFIRKMREELGVESGKKKIQPYLYAFVGMTRCHWSFWQREQHFPWCPTHPGCLFGCEARSAARPTRKTHTFTISPAS